MIKARKLINELSEEIDKQDKTIDYLRKELQRVKDEKYKDEELQKMKERYDEMSEDYYRGFPISKKHNEAISKWSYSHLKEKHPRALDDPGYFGAIGGNFHYEFIPTSIGTIGTIKCTCGDSFTFQEMD